MAIMKVKVFFKRNGATILTVLGAVGVVSTAIFTAKATVKATKIVEEAKEEKGEELTTIETVKATLPVYIPTIVMGAAAVTCIISANILNKKHQASLTSAYMMLDQTYKEYRKKVVELYGEEADKEIEESIIEDKYDKNDDKIRLFYDEYSKRFFETTLFKAQQAEYFLNRDLIMRDYAYLNEWYEYLEIDTIDEGWDIGWSIGMCMEMYWQPWIDFGHNKYTTEDGREYTKITFFGEPMKGFDEYE